MPDIRLQSHALTVKTISEIGHGGFASDVLLVPLRLAEEVLKEYQTANQLLREENDMLAKKLNAIRWGKNP